MEKEMSKVVSEAMAVEVEDARRADKLGYMARALIQATLPHKATPGNEFHRENGFFSLTILAPSKVGLPYGSIPRLLLSWMTTEAVQTRSPVLEMGPTLSAFMGELGMVPRGGKRGEITRLKNQTERLFSSTVSCQYADDTSSQGSGFRIAKDYVLWWTPKAPDQVPLWKSTVTLSTDFYKEIIERPVPVDMGALKALKRSPMALDIYFWMTYRLSYLRKDTVIPWPLLQAQFGADYAQDGHGQRNFKVKFIQRLKNVQEIYEKARVFGMDRGLVLRPSPPHVAKRRPPLLEGPGSKTEKAVAVKVIDPRLMSQADIQLRTVTYEKARELAPGLDIYYIENEWKEWIAKKGEMPKNPDKAYLGFVRKKAKQHGSEW